MKPETDIKPADPLGRVWRTLLRRLGRFKILQKLAW